MGRRGCLSTTIGEESRGGTVCYNACMKKRIINRLGKEAFGFYPLKMKEDFDSTLRALAALSSLGGVSELEGEKVETIDSEELGNLFRSHGSDKAQERHLYHRFYSSLLATRRNERLNILEIGIGTSNPKLPSTMGGWETKYTPGASLRAFRDYLPSSKIVGADIDRECLFTEDRIDTYFVDQLSPSSLADLFGTQKFDLIIDDRLHTPEANLNTLVAALPHLTKGGSIVIEDLAPTAVEYWKIAASLLHSQFESKLVHTGSLNMVFAVKQV